MITNTRETGKLEVQKDRARARTPACSTCRSTAPPTPTRRTSATAARPARRPSTPATTPSARPRDRHGSGRLRRSRSSARTTTGPARCSTPPRRRRPADRRVTTGSDIVCVITNTRETGKLEVQKDLEPEHGRRPVQPPDRRHGRRMRRTSATAAPRRRGDAQHRRPHRRRDGRHRHRPGRLRQVDRVQGRQRRGRGRRQSHGDDAGPLTVAVTNGSDIVCVITNTRETGKLEVEKNLEPDHRHRPFDLLIDGSSPNAELAERRRRRHDRRGDLEHRQPHGRRDRRHGTDLADYQKSISCGTTRTATRPPDDAGDARAADRQCDHRSDIVCMITNTRETGKLEVKKDLSPTTDPGKFDLQIDGTTDANAANVGDDGTTGEETLEHRDPHGRRGRRREHRPGRLPEVDRVQGTTTAPARSSPAQQRHAGPLNVHVTTGSDIVCMITNTRETGKLEVDEEPQPDDRPRPVRPPDRRHDRRRRRRRRRRRLDRRGDA